jgi:hypothetical protein
LTLKILYAKKQTVIYSKPANFTTKLSSAIKQKRGMEFVWLRCRRNWKKQEQIFIKTLPLRSLVKENLISAPWGEK